MFEGLFQPTHLILILIVSVLVFGPNKLPQIGAGLGKSIRDFKKAMAEGSDDEPAQAKQLPAAQEQATLAAGASAEVKKA
ncbi:MAG TPA: twin-arginine translocase TatA/TatE family subunit [Myxococcales bacterium]|nr:twin-arginine translocase TatA/TatE family subunit [Myxococcales bacterium]